MSDTINNDLKSIIATFDDSDWEEIHFKSDNLDFSLSKARSIRGMTELSVQATPSVVPLANTSTSLTPVAETQALGAVDFPDGWIVVRAPNLGAFYSAPKPGATPYVEVGQTVSPDTEVCLIEIMKLFTPVTAGVSGVVREVLVEDGALVEFDQPLILVEPV